MSEQPVPAGQHAPPAGAVEAAEQFMMRRYPKWRPDSKGAGFPWSDILDALEAAAPAIAADLRTRLDHAEQALAGDNEGVRLWMLDCAKVATDLRARLDESADQIDRIESRAREAERQCIREHILNRCRQLAVGFEDPRVVVELHTLAEELGWTGRTDEIRARQP